jgi:hypothetical protein
MQTGQPSEVPVGAGAVARFQRMTARREASEGSRQRLPAPRFARAERIVELAWEDLPTGHRLLLENVGAAQWRVVDHELADCVDDLLQSAGHPLMSQADRLGLEHAVGVWIEQLRLVLVDAGHQALSDVDDQTFEMMLARTAWHEWGHALSIVRADSADIADGERLLAIAPRGVGERIRRAGYRRSQYTHELVADIYALLMSRRRRGETGKPPWLDDHLYQLVRRISTWNG